MLKNGKHGQVIHCTKMGANSLVENTPKSPRINLPDWPAKAQNFKISMKKRFHWASIVRVAVCALDNNAEAGPPTLPLVPLPCYCAMQYTTS